MTWMDLDRDLINHGFLILIIFVVVAGLTGDGIWPIRAVIKLTKKLRKTPDADEHLWGVERKWETRASISVLCTLLGTLAAALLAGLILHVLATPDDTLTAGKAMGFVIVPLGYIFAYLGMAFAVVVTALLLALGIAALVNRIKTIVRSGQ